MSFTMEPEILLYQVIEPLVQELDIGRKIIQKFVTCVPTVQDLAFWIYFIQNWREANTWRCHARKKEAYAQF
jgi:hypothetical protein